MKKFSLLTLVCCFCLLGTESLAQEHYTNGPISRVILLKVKPGKMNDLMMDLRRNLKPIFEEEKRQGLITDYKIYLNTSTATPEDWDVGIIIQYKNYAALDDLAAKADPITLKHYGSKEARQAAADRRPERATVVSSRLVREVTLRDAATQ